MIVASLNWEKSIAENTSLKIVFSKSSLLPKTTFLAKGLILVWKFSKVSKCLLYSVEKVRSLEMLKFWAFSSVKNNVNNSITKLLIFEIINKFLQKENQFVYEKLSNKVYLLLNNRK